MFDPSKKDYTWDHDSQFTLTGIEFGATLNFLKKRKLELLKELEIINIFEKKLAESFESGIVREIPKDVVAG
jgi:hypothetical protein